MLVRVKVKCPPGQAESVEKKFRLIALPKLRRAEVPTRYLAPDGSSFYWEVETSVKGYMSIQRNIMAFNLMALGTLDSLRKRTLIKQFAKISNQTIDECKRMIDDTDVTIVKNATAEEITAANVTYWEHIKNTFKRG